MNIYRRDLLAGAAATTALSGLSVFPSAAAAATSTSDVRVAVIGVRGRGRDHLQNYGARVAAICDVDSEVLAKRSQEYAEKTSKKADLYTDYRKLLERDDVDAVSIATPNHTHSLIAIAALEAGKDVYVEKPVSHNIWEGRQLVAAARKHNRIVQCGTQCRSSRGIAEAVAWVRGGALGEILYAVGVCYKPRKSVAKIDLPLNIASTIDYDLWCGPAAKVDLYRKELHYDWHWDWNTGNGDSGNQGIHQLDIARWFLGEKGLAPRVISIGGRLGYEDAGNTPNTQVVYYDYPKAPLLFETRGLPRSKAGQLAWGNSMDVFRGAGIGVIVQCEAGHVLVPDYSHAIAYDREGAELKRWSGGGNHYENFLQSVVVQDRSRLNCEIQEGHLSSAMCHLAAASHRIGKGAMAQEIATSLVGNDLLSQTFERMASHLRANGVDIDSTEQSLTLGPWLDIDDETERFVNNAEADALYRRDDRKPFVVPDYGA